MIYKSTKQIADFFDEIGGIPYDVIEAEQVSAVCVSVDILPSLPSFGKMDIRFMSLSDDNNEVLVYTDGIVKNIPEEKQQAVIEYINKTNGETYCRVTGYVRNNSFNIAYMIDRYTSNSCLGAVAWSKMEDIKDYVSNHFINVLSLSAGVELGDN